MDWKSKFSSILRETEANLSKARHRYHIDGTPSLRAEWRNPKYSLQQSTSPLDFPVCSTPKLVHQNGFSTSESPIRQISTNNPLGVHPDSPFLGQSLQDRVEQQNRIIEQLKLQVQRLEKERDQYNEQFRDLKSEIYRLGVQIMEKPSNSHSKQLEQRIEQIRQELRSEIILLKTQIQNYQTYQTQGSSLIAQEMPTLQDSNMDVCTKDFIDVKNMQSKIDVVRQDMELLKGRLVTLEANIATKLCNQLDNEREMLRREQITIPIDTKPKKPTRRTAYKYLPGLTAQQQIEQLRQTVLGMKKKLENIELKSRKHNLANAVVNGFGVSREKLVVSDAENESVLSDSDQSSLRDYLSDNLTNDGNSEVSSSFDGDTRLDDLSLSEDDDSVLVESIGNGDDDKTSMTSGCVFQSDNSGHDIK